MFIEQSNRLIRLLWRATWRKDAHSRTVYLTFDDGPSPEVTPKTLQILDRYNVKATFFCVGDNVQKHPEVFALLRAHGHAVGNHTMHHLKGFSTDFNTYLNDVAQADRLIQSRLLRPPYGRITFKQLRALRVNYEIIMWDVITRDYNPKLSPDKIFHIIKRYTRNGSIIVFHDSCKAAHNMLETLPKAIEWLQAQGYGFSVIPDHHQDIILKTL
ncbi:MAG: polysaccharide deacetylase family protein [Prevotellaceae bacterium]|jgi:peptidoglycan/xylan/chitin deacetylase (PgdA/CDA1 family)|nr:polysaccharide deacetylase family protein [Prevotellaceae bacterium]